MNLMKSFSILAERRDWRAKRVSCSDRNILGVLRVGSADDACDNRKIKIEMTVDY